MLEASEFDAIAGTTEDGSIDFKIEPYQLGSEAGKYELAKDVAAFARTQDESVIVFPVETEVVADSPFERAVRARPIRRRLVDEKQILDVIRSHVYPGVRGVDVRTFASADDEERCLVAIVVPAQREADQPFLVVSPVGNDGTKIQGWLIGMPVRSGDETEHVRLEQLHELISRGRGLAARVEEIAAMIAHPAAPANPEFDPDELWAHASSVADRYSGELHSWEGRRLPPILILAAAPTHPTTVPTLLRDEGVRQLLEHPPMTRHEGWNLGTLSRAELVEGSKLEVRGGHRKLLSLSDDGFFVAIARIEEFLSRDRVKTGADAVAHKVSSLALVEFTHDFVLTFKAIIDFLDPPPEDAYFAVAVIAATGSPDGAVFLPPYGVRSIEWGYAGAPGAGELPDTSDYTWGYTASMSRSAGEIAYPLLEHVYGFFKHASNAIPYLNEERSAVEPERFGDPASG